jgi:tetratricopeptide (TPR) repeat protein
MGRRVVLMEFLWWSAVALPGPSLAQSLLSPTTSVAQQYHAHALELAASGQHAEAGAWFRRAWEQDRAETRYVHDLTVYYIHHHKYSDALAIIRDCVERLGPTALAWTLQGELLFEKKEYDPAYQALRSALDLSNINYRAHELIGLIFSVHRRYALALEELKLAAEQNPASAQVRFYCGRLYYRTANYPLAREELLACLKLQPGYPEALENLGLTYEAIGEPSTAIIQYRQAIELEKAGKTPSSELPYVCLGVLLNKESGNEEALPLLREAVAKNPNSAWANFELGRMYFQAGKDTLAERHLKRSAELDKNYSRPHFLLGKLYARARRQPESQSEFATFQALDKDLDNRQPQLTR